VLKPLERVQGTRATSAHPYAPDARATGALIVTPRRIQIAFLDPGDVRDGGEGVRLEKLRASTDSVFR